MTICKSREANFILLSLIFASFNDWMRIPSTPISFYRIVLPLLFIGCLNRLRKSGWWYLWGSAFIVLNIVQNVIFSCISKIEPNVRLSAQFFYFYASIAVIFASVKLLRKKHRDVFKRLLFSILPKIGIVNLLIYWIKATSFNNLFFLANRNNYAVSLVAIFPYFFLQGLSGKRWNFLFCILTVVSLAGIGSKSATLGIMIEFLLIIAMKCMKRVKNTRCAGICIFASVLLAAVTVVQSPMTIHGYPISYMFSEMKDHILSGMPYKNEGTSLRYRTNAIIYMMNYIKESRGVGIGIGNTGVYLTKSMPKAFQGNRETLSPHMALIEFFSDCGLWAIVLFFLILLSAIRKIIQAKEADFVDIYFVSFTFSFPIFCMSASSIYTIYYLFIIMACFYEWYQMKNETTNVTGFSPKVISRVQDCYEK